MQAAREALALSIVESCKNCNDGRRRDFLAYLAGETPHAEPLQDSAVQEFMSWNDVRGLSAAGFELGSHTMTHPILSNISSEDLEWELRESRAAIELQTGVRCKALAYPNGRTRDIADTVLAAATDAGYELAFTVSNQWCPRTRDALQLDRISPPSYSSLATFAFHASGCRQLFHRLTNGRAKQPIGTMTGEELNSAGTNSGVRQSRGERKRRTS